MFDYTDDVKIVSSFKKSSKPYRKISNRATHGFIFKIKGSAEYHFADKTITVKEGEFIFLPKGCAFTYTTSPGESLYTSINFQATLGEPAVRVYSAELCPNAHYIIQNFTEFWNFGTVCEKHQCNAMLYELLSCVSRYEHFNSEDNRKLALIAPAVEYLKHHIYDSDLKIDKLHRLCGISDTYFRKIFLLKFNMTPQQYVSTQRIAHARSIIESGDYESLKEISEAVGYTDALYFSKAFKKAYGFSPSILNKQLQ